MLEHVEVIGFDADDTLWDNEPYFREAENFLGQLLMDYMPADKVIKNLLDTEIKNIRLYGFGIKSFILSMVETALKISGNTIPQQKIEQILNAGKTMLEKPVTLIRGVSSLLESLNNNYRIVVATKGDLLDQERKLKKSGIAHYFDHVEIMSDKTEDDYKRLFRQLNIKAKNFLMIGNSLKSDIIPVLNVGGYAAHVPYYTLWEHELSHETINSDRFIELKRIDDVNKYLNNGRL